jgi:hypothetical protein
MNVQLPAECDREMRPTIVCFFMFRTELLALGDRRPTIVSVPGLSGIAAMSALSGIRGNRRSDRSDATRASAEL